MDTRARIFELLDKKKIEQKAFAAEVGVSPSIVSNWRKGKSNSYNDHLVKIAQVLGVTTSDLLGETRSVPDSDTLGAADVQVLAAYHAAPAEIRAIVDAALKPYIG
nr:MAG TPA: helix-turn-helix domain protein [Caudoviricetes sp.]